MEIAIVYVSNPSQMLFSPFGRDAVGREGNIFEINN
jgi:hypothetical protein